MQIIKDENKKTLSIKLSKKDADTNDSMDMGVILDNLMNVFVNTCVE